MTFCNFILKLQILYVMLTTVIRLQKLAMSATGRRTSGPPFFQGEAMSRKSFRPVKPFLTYQELLVKLSDDKNLIIPDLESAKSILTDISYYALMNGYKSLYYDRITRQYVTGTSFNDILALCKPEGKNQSALPRSIGKRACPIPENAYPFQECLRPQ